MIRKAYHWWAALPLAQQWVIMWAFMATPFFVLQCVMPENWAARITTLWALGVIFFVFHMKGRNRG